MRLSVKSQSGILFVLLSMHGPSAHREHGFVPSLFASSVLAFFLSRRSSLTARWGRAAGQKECSPWADAFHPRLVAGEVLRRLASCAGRAVARTTVYPWDARHGATTLDLVRSERPGRQFSRVNPSNERCLRRSPGGRTATLSDSFAAPIAAVISLLRVSLQARSRRPSHGRRLPRMTPCRRADIQAPVLLLGPLGQLAPMHPAP